MKYKTYYTPKAKFDLNKLEFGLRKRIVKKVQFFRSSSNPLQHAKKLKDQSIAQYRFRIGDYRVLFDVDQYGGLTILIIIHVKHRKKVYKFK